jgi:membrane-associated phospholipid phosphatase
MICISGCIFWRSLVYADATWQGFAAFHSGKSNNDRSVIEIARVDRGKEVTSPIETCANWLEKSQVLKFSPSSVFLIFATFIVSPLLGWVVLKVYGAKGAIPLDTAIIDRLMPVRSSGIVSLFKWVGHFGSGDLMIFVVVVTSGFLAVGAHWRCLLAFWFAVSGTQITTYVGKQLISRPRPGTLSDLMSSSSSFPSAHAASAMVIWGMVGYVIGRNHQGLPRISVYATGVIILLVATSLIFRNVHYPTDVAAGLLIGLFWLLVGIALSQAKASSGLPR